MTILAEIGNPYSLQRRENQEFRFLHRGDRFVDFSGLTNQTDRLQAAQEMRAVLLDSLFNNQMIRLEAYTDEEVAADPQLGEKVFGSIRPSGKLLGLFRLADKFREGMHFTVSVFENDEELVVHRDTSDNWDNQYDASQATAVTIASAIILNPVSQLSVTDARISTAKYEQLLMLSCLGFKPDQRTIPLGPFQLNPRYVLEGIK